jgi:hypothetical protein
MYYPYSDSFLLISSSEVPYAAFRQLIK